MPTVIGALNGGFVGWISGMAGFGTWQAIGCAAISSLLMCAFGWAVA